ncbi:MAG: hypothetical protein JSV64_08095 [Candidatus Bathyarchaeota archaeon]|nr:MAG: hypothetical protein JSV64_08095 [Candidatus Bathyarchaeota archaeon]
MKEPEPQYEFFVEWKVRRIPEPPKEPKATYNQRIQEWVLSSIGVEGTTRDVFGYIEDSDAATIEDLKEHFQCTVDETQDHVDQLYSLGLIDHIGKAYFVRDSVSSSIVKRLIPRITENLRSIAKAESRSRSDSGYYQKMRGRSFSDVGSAIAACKEIARLGRAPIARAIGVHSFNSETIEVEGPVSNYGYSPQHLVIISESGEKVIVGNKNSKGADVQAHSIIVKGDKNE